MQLDSASTPTAPFAFLPVYLGPKDFFVPIGQVISVRGSPKHFPTQTWNAPGLNMMTFRGDVLSVLDLRTYLGIPSLDGDQRFRPMVVVEEASLRMGWIVDRTGPIRSTWKRPPPELVLDLTRLTEGAYGP